MVRNLKLDDHFDLFVQEGGLWPKLRHNDGFWDDFRGKFANTIGVLPADARKFNPDAEVEDVRAAFDAGLIVFDAECRLVEAL